MTKTRKLAGRNSAVSYECSESRLEMASLTVRSSLDSFSRCCEGSSHCKSFVRPLAFCECHKDHSCTFGGMWFLT